MCKFVGKIKQIIPFKGEIEKIDSYVGEFIKNYKSPIYDNELPIEWNTVEIANAGNKMYPYAPANRVKISSLVPTLDELEWMKIIWSSGGSEYELIFDSSGTNAEGYNVATFKNTAYNIAEYFTIVPKGKNIPHGLYWYTNNFSANDVTESGWNYSLYLPVAYDDEFPIEWNSLEVFKLANVKYGRFIKVSNLTPTIDEMKSVQIVVGNETFVYSSHLGDESVDFKVYTYTSENNKFIVQVFEKVHDGYEPAEVGIYIEDVYAKYGEIVDCTLAVVTPTGIYDDEFPIEWNSTSVANNVTIDLDGTYAYKVSNLMPTYEELTTAILTVNGEDYTFTTGEKQDIGSVAMFGSYAFAVYVVTQAGELDGIVLPETGIYVWHNDYDYTDFTLTLPVTATHYLYGREADSVVSYNGVPLPDIESVWTDELKQTYPYATINAQFLSQSEIEEMVQMGYAVEDGAGVFVLQVYDTALVYNGTKLDPLETTKSCVTQITNSQALHDLYDSMGYGSLFPLEWEGLVENTDAADRSLDNPIWTSHDILNADGSVYLAASDPVKSYTDPDVFIGDVGYVGAVLPPVPAEFAEYPYRFIKYESITEYYYLYGLKEKPVTTYHEINAALNKGYDIYWSENECDYLCFYFSKYFGGEWTLSSEGTGILNVAVSNICWSNNDVYTSDGELNLSLSDPIPLPQPDMYSYNGEAIAELPEWDKAAYPYAFIVNYIGGNPDATGYALYAYANKPTLNDSVAYGNHDSSARITCTTNNERTCWWMFTDSSTITASSNLSNIVWANHDIYDADGNLFMTASEPTLL